MNPYRLIADFYDANIDPNLYQDFLDLIQEEIQEGYALDLATGTGQMAFLLAEHGFVVDATDVSLAMLKEAERHLSKTSLPVKLYVHDILEPISSNKYDCVTLASDVVNHLCHIDDVKEVFTHVASALKDHGVFVFDAIHQEYMDSMIGYEDELVFKDKTLYWSVKKESNQSLKHYLKVKDEEAHLIQYIYSDHELSEALLLNKLTIKKTIKTEERTIFLVKKDQ